jgi:hypothetical protein
MNETLEPISPAEAKEMYLNARKHEVSQSTLDGYHYRLKHFIRWCENVEGLEDMNDLTGRKLQFLPSRRDLRSKRTRIYSTETIAVLHSTPPKTPLRPLRICRRHLMRWTCNGETTYPPSGLQPSAVQVVVHECKTR